MIMAAQKDFDIDFDAELPANRNFFPVWELAKSWHCSVQHIINLVESGELKVPVDLKGKSATKTMIRVPRASVVEFLNRRKVRP
jgi:hypothetical protein